MVLGFVEWNESCEGTDRDIVSLVFFFFFFLGGVNIFVYFMEMCVSGCRFTFKIIWVHVFSFWF